MNADCSRTLRFLWLVVTQQELTDTRCFHFHWLIQSAETTPNDTDRLSNFDSLFYMRELWLRKKKWLLTVMKPVRDRTQPFRAKLSILFHVWQPLSYGGVGSWGSSLGSQGQKDNLLPLYSFNKGQSVSRVGRAEWPPGRQLMTGLWFTPGHFLWSGLVPNHSVTGQRQKAVCHV